MSHSAPADRSKPKRRADSPSRQASARCVGCGEVISIEDGRATVERSYVCERCEQSLEGREAILRAKPIGSERGES
jgi:hypothetical protein